MPRVAVVFTSHGAWVKYFRDILEQTLDGCEIMCIADSSLIGDVQKQGVDKAVYRRVFRLFDSAAEARAEIIVCACSSIGDVANLAAPLYDMPVLRIDRPMIEEAVAGHSRIGVLATLATTLDPTTSEIGRAAGEAGKAPLIVPRVVEGAYQAQSRGDTEKHDKLILEAAGEMKGDVDIILLAQGSMSRMTERLRENIGIPVVGSPIPCANRLRKMLGII